MIDALICLALLAPVLVGGLVLRRGFRPGPLVRALLWRYRWTNAAFLLMIAVAVALGVGVIAQERGLRIGTANAAAKFPLVVGAPGSEMTLMLAAVYLQGADTGLLDGSLYESIASESRVQLAAPVAFGDSHAGDPVIGTIAEFVTHLTEGDIAGRVFARAGEAVVGAYSDLKVGDHFHPAHGHGSHADDAAHEGFDLEVVGKMHPTGSPWDRAVLVPIETIWEVHGLANGHAGNAVKRIGPPFDAAYFPGTPAVIVVPTDLGASYALRARFNRDGESMAFFPGAVLADLYRVMGDVRQGVTILTGVTQALVGGSVLVGLLILSRLFQRQLAMLTAVGAPRRFVLAVTWSYAATLLVIGSAVGLALGYGAAWLLGRLVTARTDILVQAVPGWSEVQLTCAFLSVMSLLALLPALAVLRRSVADSLRA